MNLKLILPPSWLRFLVIILLVLGVFFRFTNLDQKVYWFDEIMTSVKIGAYTDYDVEAFNGQIISVKELNQKYNTLDPEITVIDTIKNLSVKDPKHTPLYFVMARFWIEWFGSSIAVIRSLSALLSLLLFPCLYWLCLELFQSSLVAWVAMGLIAVSPLHFLYAVEARMYGLHTVIILLSSAALLRAMRQKNKLSWGIYAITISLGLYTHTLFGLVAIGHGIYVAITEGFTPRKTLINYLIASLLGLLTFIPWFFCIFNHPKGYFFGLIWQTKPIPLSSLLTWWVINLSRIFVDFNPTYQVDTDFSSFKNPLSISLIFLVLMLVFYAIYFLISHTPKEIWLFVLILVFLTHTTLAAQDVFQGGIRSFNARYLIASYLGIHLAVAYLLATKIISVSSREQKFWQMAMIALISSGIISCMLILPQKIWWNKAYNSVSPQIASIVNESNNPLLLITDVWKSQNNLWSISQFLEETVKIQLVTEANLTQIPDGFSEVFLFNPSDKLQARLIEEQLFKIEPLTGDGGMSLWRLYHDGND
ncbi:MAG: glycosyltransferase family 39 protein [Gomphosphaeria aponina SAG 52.96 = DSM 107014]|uniref:Glycosyltransferase family 39 protein n=1 Tax=Gomphosphaeria aponina SAG 52.96 = DSM 107014 TaxID=1521640 RepID=A0A941GSE1_9CHRO|nr:glycosyltransferase family 39 protein [Gomphosphaeria aponina SAG 52.96 = DSM 107014]